jgi:cell pole-organizing protein PopZ
MGDMQQDPSMEEILASIKRVIAEDGRIAAARTPRAKPAEAAEPAPPSPPVDEDVLELDDPVSENGPGLMSDGATAASRQRLASLSALRQRAETPPEPGALEAAVREMLRPMLKAWLDENLPEIVESLVTREIARITGRSL